MNSACAGGIQAAGEEGREPVREFYEVFARAADDQPLLHVGAVRAMRAEDAAVFARCLYDEWNWTEMFVVPRRSLIPVIRADGEKRTGHPGG